MPALSAHQSNEFTKLLLIGDAKSGKTGALVSLVAAGYKLRILDMDNLLDILKELVIKECPDKISNVEFRTLRDKRKATQTGPEIDGTPKAYVQAIRMLDNWKYTADNGEEIDLGKPAEWGPDCILVIDSLSRLCDAAYDFRVPLTPTSEATGKFDGRAVYGDAQDAIENNIANLTSSNFKTNVIVIAHVLYMKQADGTDKGFPQGVGQKLSPKIPQYFPNVVFCTKSDSGKRVLRTNSTPLIDLATSKPFAISPSYPAETGLAEIFTALRSQPEEDAEQPKPTKVTKLQQRR